VKQSTVTLYLGQCNEKVVAYGEQLPPKDDSEVLPKRTDTLAATGSKTVECASVMHIEQFLSPLLGLTNAAH